MPVQGTAADILKKALSMLPLVLRDTGTQIIGCIHDEILLETPQPNSQWVKDILTDTMEEAGRYYLTKVPVIAEAHVADSWAEK